MFSSSRERFPIKTKRLNHDSTNYAALYALSWLLSEDAQETMYIDNSSYVPLNKNVLDVYVDETHKNDSLNYLKDISL